MASLSEAARQGDIVRWEVERNFSREEVTLAAASTTTVKRGTVLGIITASGKYVPSVQGATDGSQNAVAVALDDIATNTTGVAATVLRRMGIILQTDLVWDSSYTTQNQKDAAITNLKTSSNILAVAAVRTV